MEVNREKGKDTKRRKYKGQILPKQTKQYMYAIYG